MASKQDEILKAARAMFLRHGYKAASTKNIAILAGVSEALIFKHYQNKTNLLEKVNEQVSLEIIDFIKPVLQAPDPSSILSAAIDLPFKITRQQLVSWQLQERLSWENNDHSFRVFQQLEPYLYATLKISGLPNPEEEAKILIAVLEAIINMKARKETADYQSLRQVLAAKYLR